MKKDNIVRVWNQKDLNKEKKENSIDKYKILDELILEIKAASDVEDYEKMEEISKKAIMLFPGSKQPYLYGCLFTALIMQDKYTVEDIAFAKEFIESCPDTFNKTAKKYLELSEMFSETVGIYYK